METKAAIAALSALAQDTRLAVFRLLVVAGPAGMPAGDIAASLNAPPNTISTNLSILSAAGLVRSQREGRIIRYFVQMEGMAALLTYLLRDCCQGNSDLCLPVMDQLKLLSCTSGTSND
jgi:DNA-binding transcriptional ArsR family regulator